MPPFAGNGLIHIESDRSVEDTVTRLELVLQSKSIPVLARIDHSGDAAKAGLVMQPTKLLIFGNAKSGTPLMLASPTVAIDLPLKVLIWRDSEDKVWVSYNDPNYLKTRHLFPDDLLGNIAGIRSICEAAAR